MRRTRLRLMKNFLGALIILAATATAPALAAPVTQIAVMGTGTVTMLPDEATVNASITTTDPRAETATGRNSAAYESATKALLARGIARSDITLSYYNVNYQPKPQAVDGNPPPPGVYGYTVNRSFSVKVRNMGSSGSIVDALSPIDGIEINGVTFGLSNSAGARDQATGKAVADARSKATALARAAGLRISAIQRIDLEGNGIMPLPMMMKANTMGAPSAPTTFDPGNVNVTVNVNVVFSASP